MSRNALFWGILLIIAGVLLGLQATGVVQQSIWGYFFGCVLILMGIWTIFGMFGQPKFDASSKFNVALDGAKNGQFSFELGAGALDLSSGASTDIALEGVSGQTLDVKSNLEGDLLKVEVEAGPSFLPFLGPSTGAWMFKLNNELPMTISVEGGASSYKLNRRDLKVSHLSIETGASSTWVELPAAAGNTLVEIEGGASSYDIRVPEGVAARIRVKQGATALHIDEKRFPSNRDGYYLSADYDTAQNRADINIEVGAGSVTVK